MKVFEIIFICLAVIMILSVLSIFYFNYRNDLVFKERWKILNKIAELCIEDDYYDCSIRCYLYNNITYNEMVFSFKPVESFYKNHECLQKRRLRK